MSLFLWEESRLQSNGVATTYVVSLKAKKDYVCRRQNQKEAQGVLAKCQQLGLTTLAELKKFVKTLRKEDTSLSCLYDFRVIVVVCCCLVLLERVLCCWVLLLLPSCCVKT